MFHFSSVFRPYFTVRRMAVGDVGIGVVAFESVGTHADGEYGHGIARRGESGEGEAGCVVE